MSTKAWVTSGADFSLYHDLTLDDEEPNDVYLELDDARELLVEKECGRKGLRTRIQLPCEMLDQIAIAWIKHRQLQGAVGGPVGLEWGSPDCPYD